MCVTKGIIAFKYSNVYHFTFLYTTFTSLNHAICIAKHVMLTPRVVGAIKDSKSSRCKYKDYFLSVRNV